MNDQHSCTKCGSARTHVVGESIVPAMRYVQCADCGRTMAVMASPPVQESTVRAYQVERIVLSVLLEECARPFELLCVVDIDSGWDVIVRTETRRLKRFHLARAAPDVMRATIRQSLDNM